MDNSSFTWIFGKKSSHVIRWSNQFVLLLRIILLKACQNSSLPLRMGNK